MSAIQVEKTIGRALLVLLLGLPAGGLGAAEFSSSEAAEINFRDPTRQSLPPWVLGLDHNGGELTRSPGSWLVRPNVPPNTGQLIVELDRKQLRDDLTMGLAHENLPGARLMLQLWDKNNRVLAADLSSNFVTRFPDTQTDTYAVPLSRFPKADKLAICRVTGRVQIYSLMLQPVPKAAADRSAISPAASASTRTTSRPALSNPATPGYAVAAGPQLIDEPRDGARVQRAVAVSGRAPKIPEGHHLYIFQCMEPDFWPKGDELFPVDGKWQTVVRHGGHNAASYAIGLFEVTPEAHERFTAWRAEARRTGKYPPIKDMTGTILHSKVRVKVLPD